nr:ubiquinol-cytochrome c reductase iron-sulfur subunit [Thermanaeromonas sp. C210]
MPADRIRGLSRRQFLTLLMEVPVVLGVTTPLVLTAGALSPPRSLRPLPPRMAVAKEEEVGEKPVEFIYDGYPAILFKKDGEYKAFSRVCTHLGCIVAWKEEEQVFECPCHGGVFDAEGKVVKGPPPEPLHRLAVWVENGLVMVEKEVG